MSGRLRATREAVLRFLRLALPALLLAACGGSPDPAGTGGATSSSSTSSTTTTHWPTGTTSATCTGGEGGALPESLQADGGDQQRVDHGEVVTLHGSAVSPRCGATFDYLWTQTGGTAVTLDDPSSPTPSFTAPDEDGTLSFRLEVSDELGEAASSVAWVEVGFYAPVAHAGPDRGGLGGEVVSLQGRGEDAQSLPLTYAWSQVSGPKVPLDDPASQTPSVTIPAGLDEPLVYALVVDDGHRLSQADRVTVRRLSGPDADGDLLEDELEVSLGLDPHDADTDHDGIPDGWEVLGHEGMDYAALGCDPRHRDLLVEMDVQEFTDSAGVFHTARPTAGVTAALTSFYAALPLPNPDGIDGISLRFVDGAILPQGFVCSWGGGVGCTIQDAPLRTEHREAFHRASFCAGAAPSGCGDIEGSSFAVNFGGFDADPTNDLDEVAAYDFYRIFVHEMGHNLGLHHGGDEETNYKPNYPSVMNYAYFGPYTEGSIASGVVYLSHGAVPDVDECALVEAGIFAGVADTSFLARYQIDQGWTAAADGSVDWNRDGTISGAPYSAVIRAGAGTGTPCALLHDSDDYAGIDQGMGPAIPAGRKTPWGWWAQRKRVSVP